MGLDHLLLREAIRGTADDRVQPVRHMGALVMRKDQEVKRSRHLLLPQVQGLAAVGTQKRHLKLSRTGGEKERLICFCCRLTLNFL